MTKKPVDEVAKVQRQREAEVGALMLYARETFGGSTRQAYEFMNTANDLCDGRTPSATVLAGEYHRVEKILTDIKKGQQK